MAQALYRCTPDGEATMREHSPDYASVPSQPVEARDSAPMRPNWLALLAICAAWFGLWYLAPGISDNGVGRLITNDPVSAILIETVLALVLCVPLILVHRRYNQKLFARSKQIYLYAVPAALAIALPFHYGLELPVGVYLLWMTVSVFWQDYLTFGLLQSYLRERFPAFVTVLVVAGMFYAVHAVLIPERFALTNPLPSLAIFTLGIVLALIRTKLEAMHVILALHLSFYFIFA